MANKNFEYYPSATPNTATSIFNVSASNTITVIVAEKEAFSNTYKSVDAFIPNNWNYWKFLNYCKEYKSDDSVGNALNTLKYLDGAIQTWVYEDSTYTTTLSGKTGSSPNSDDSMPSEIDRYIMYVKESIIDTDIYNVTTISIPNYIIDAQGNITVGTPTTQTIKTLKPLASITNLLPIQFA